MASYIIQAEVGNFNHEIHRDFSYIMNRPLAPIHIQTPKFMEIVRELHQQRR